MPSWSTALTRATAGASRVNETESGSSPATVAPANLSGLVETCRTRRSRIRTPPFWATIQLTLASTRYGEPGYAVGAGRRVRDDCSSPTTSTTASGIADLVASATWTTISRPVLHDDPRRCLSLRSARSVPILEDPELLAVGGADEDRPTVETPSSEIGMANDPSGPDDALVFANV